MDKPKSIWPKIFWTIGIIFLLIIIFVGFTIYQVSSTLKIIKEETPKIQESSSLLIEQRDCSQLNIIKISVDKITNSVSGACKNPVLNFAINRIEEVPIKCANLSQLKSDIESRFNEAKLYCENPAKLNESIANGNLSKEELMTLAQKYGIKV